VLPGPVARDGGAVALGGCARRPPSKMTSFGDCEHGCRRNDLLDDKPILDLSHQVFLTWVRSLRSVVLDLSFSGAMQIREEPPRDHERPRAQVAGVVVRNLAPNGARCGFLDEIVNVVPIDSDGAEVAAQGQFHGWPGRGKVGCNCCGGAVWTLWRGVS